VRQHPDRDRRPLDHGEVRGHPLEVPQQVKVAVQQATPGLGGDDQLVASSHHHEALGTQPVGR
jgi:hypothetical protein